MSQDKCKKEEKKYVNKMMNLVASPWKAPKRQGTKGQEVDKEKINIFSVSFCCLNHLEQADLDFVTGK